MTNNAINDELPEVESIQSFKWMMKPLLWVLVVISILSLAYYQFTRDDILPIQKIEITGEFKHLSLENVQHVVDLGVTRNFFTVDVDSMYQKMIRLPWVEKVWIHRIWPNTIKIHFQEQIPIAILKNKGLLNKSGEVFSSNFQSFKQTLPLFIVANNYIQESVVEYEKKLNILQVNGLEARVFYYDERKAQIIILSNGIELVLGRVDVAKRLNKFVKAYKSHLQYDERKIEKIDLRYTNGLAVSWKQSKAKFAFFNKQVAS